MASPKNDGCFRHLLGHKRVRSSDTTVTRSVRSVRCTNKPSTVDATVGGRTRPTTQMAGDVPARATSTASVGRVTTRSVVRRKPRSAESRRRGRVRRRRLRSRAARRVRVRAVWRAVRTPFEQPAILPKGVSQPSEQVAPSRRTAARQVAAMTPGDVALASVVAVAWPPASERPCALDPIRRD